MDIQDIYARLPEALLPWYREHKRDLPWRQDRLPYHIWLSEIMLQQTRVEAVRGYYTRFLETLPTIHALAQCDDDALQKLWEGLGYYSRVRNLKKAANVIIKEYGGQFPRLHRQVLALPGIGPYTAGAICSIAYDLPTPAVDGNVLRLAARLTNDPTPVQLPAFRDNVQQQLERVYPPQAGEFTQALMELGATLCGPDRAPRCEECPCRSFCMGCQLGTAPSLPKRLPKKEKRLEEKTVFILSCDGRYALEKRPAKGLLAGLWQFPNADGLLELPAALDWVRSRGTEPREVYRQVQRSHIFTHVRWEMQGIYLEVSRCAEGWQWFTPEQIEQQAALPTAFRQFWEEFDHV